MSKKILIFILAVIVTIVFSSQIKAIDSGTLVIKDEQIRQSKSIVMQIPLTLSPINYKNFKNIDVIASITKMQLDEYLNFYFVYPIWCSTQKCFLNFTLTIQTKTINPKFQYYMEIDYLVARGLKIIEKNMTGYQEHVMVRMDLQFYSYDNKQQMIKKPYNNKDAPLLLMFPNGFSDISLTGKIVYSYISFMEMYTIHYMNQDHDEADQQGWINGQDFITYRIVFYDGQDLHEKQICNGKEIYMLHSEEYTYQCDSFSSFQWFYGLRGYEGSHLTTKFSESRYELKFKMEDIEPPNSYSLVILPFLKSDSFVDGRLDRYQYTVEAFIFLAFLIIVIGVAILMIIKKLFRKSPPKNVLQETQLQSDIKA